MPWDRIRIEPHDERPGNAALYLMWGDSRLAIVIASLPIFGVPSKTSILADADWRLMLDVIAGIVARSGRDEAVIVETSDGETWEYQPEAEP